MKVINTNDQKTFGDFVAESIKGEEGCAIHVADKICVWTGKSSGTYKLPQGSDIEVYQGYYFGGSIVCFPDDITICVTTHGDNDYCKRFIEWLCRWMVKSGMAAEIDGNDILLGGKKVASWARGTAPNFYCQSFAHMSIGMDIEMIRKICTKPMEKVPAGLSEYGIDSATIMRSFKKTALWKEVVNHE